MEMILHLMMSFIHETCYTFLDVFHFLLSSFLPTLNPTSYLPSSFYHLIACPPSIPSLTVFHSYSHLDFSSHLSTTSFYYSPLLSYHLLHFYTSFFPLLFFLFPLFSSSLFSSLLSSLLYFLSSPLSFIPSSLFKLSI